MEVIQTNAKFVLTDEEVKAIRTVRDIFFLISESMNENETVLAYEDYIINEVKDVLNDFVRALKYNNTIESEI